MPAVTVDWSEGWLFDGYDSKGMPVDIDGKQKLGSKPSDLLPMALAACSATDLVIVLGESEGKLTGLRVEASYTQEPDPPWKFRRIRMHYTVTGHGLTDAAVAEAIRRSEEEMCSVAASLRGSVAIESSFELTEGS